MNVVSRLSVTGDNREYSHTFARRQSLNELWKDNASYAMLKLVSIYPSVNHERYLPGIDHCLVLVAVIEQHVKLTCL